MALLVCSHRVLVRKFGWHKNLKPILDMGIEIFLKVKLNQNIVTEGIGHNII